MKALLRILEVEDSEDDALLILNQIKKGGYDIEYERVDTPGKMETALKEKIWDIVLSDYKMPHFNGLKALALLKESGIDLPFIIISGTIGEEIAVEAMKAGAHDYLMKNNLVRLLPAIERELRESKSRVERKRLEEEQKQSEEMLRESEERYRLIAENTADTIAVLDLNLNITYISPSVLKLRGYSPQEARAQLIHQIFAPASLQKVNKLFDDQMALESTENADKSRTESIELEEYCKDGSTIWVEVALSFIRDVNLKATQILTVTRDITERKLAQEKLGILSRAVEQSPASIVITDTDGNIEYINYKFTEVTGYSKDEILHQNPRVLKSGEMSPEGYKQLWQTITSGKEWYGEFHNKKKNGNLYWERASISPIFDLSGNITHYLAVKEDITKHKQEQAELLKAKEKAEESDRLKSAFLATMNHELRTPLNHILGFSDLIQSGINQEDAAEYAGIIHKSGQYLLEIIEDIFELVVVEKSGAKLRKETFKCLDLFLINKSSLTEIRDTYGKKDQIALSFSPDNRLLTNFLTADKNKINQVLVNLFKNAVKFTNSGEIEFGFQMKKPGWITFYVRDTGIGIAEDKHELIFEFFRQGDDSNTRIYGGIGIGLAIAKKIAELMDGSLSLKSEPGKGSIFYFTFPAEMTTMYSEGTDLTKLSTVPVLEGKLVLIVEDDPLSMNLIRTFVKSSGAKVIESFNGKEAIEKLDEHPDIILMDLYMPVMDGFQATQIIKSRQPEIPIIAVTAYALIKDRSEALSAGCDSIVSKPVDKEILFGELTKFLKGK